ncbi:MAG: hypothetical protein A2Z37_15020 [Chloroflexi bacterium RBG_19FT_COMBO_62_14]|nr:MAG: hypothetical protein A2Z37_15020 [Chloroflexi bacterium RBG_19FT_COMBO_62_14]
MPVTRIEVTDLYSAFYEIAQRIWSEPDFRGQALPGTFHVGDYWYAVEDYLEEHLFLAGCARRFSRLTGRALSISEVAVALRVCDHKGNVRPGDSGHYHGSGFDWGKPDDEVIRPLIIAGDLKGDRIGQFRLFVEAQADG